MPPDYIFNVSYVNNQNEIIIIYGITDPKVLSRMVVDESGVLKRSTWHKHRWIQFWSAPKESCDKYKYCGSNGYCDFYSVDKFEYMCLLEFKPKAQGDWGFLGISIVRRFYIVS